MDMIIDEYPKALREKLRQRIRKVFLFGSRSRGDFTNASDYDFAIIVDKRSKDIEDAIDEVTGDFLYRYSELIGPIIWDEFEWEERKKIPIGINILREGREV